jgi:hypothetical protein
VQGVQNMSDCHVSTQCISQALTTQGRRATVSHVRFSNMLMWSPNRLRSNLAPT